MLFPKDSDLTKKADEINWRQEWPDRFSHEAPSKAALSLVISRCAGLLELVTTGASWRPEAV